MVSAKGLRDVPGTEADSTADFAGCFFAEVFGFAGDFGFADVFDFADAFELAEDFDFVLSALVFFPDADLVFRVDAPAGAVFLDFCAVFAVLLLDLDMYDLRIQVCVDSEN